MCEIFNVRAGNRNFSVTRLDNYLTLAAHYIWQKYCTRCGFITLENIWVFDMEFPLKAEMHDALNYYIYMRLRKCNNSFTFLFHKRNVLCVCGQTSSWIGSINVLWYEPDELVRSEGVLETFGIIQEQENCVP